MAIINKIEAIIIEIGNFFLGIILVSFGRISISASVQLPVKFIFA